MAALAALGAERKSYLMVYHKDADHSLHMAVSDDSHNWRAVNGDKPVVKGEDIAVQKGIRGPFEDAPYFDGERRRLDLPTQWSAISPTSSRRRQWCNNGF